MEQPTEEQLKEFLQWCGIQCYYKDETNTDIEAWICPPDSEKTVAFYGLTLDFLFKYAVPKIKEMGRGLRITTGATTNYGCEITPTPTTYSEYAENDDPALALFWALWKVKEKSGE